jgi:alkylation response protein AidB-like acyl-CoA dehydrogenase
VLEKPQYKRLQIGVLANEQPLIKSSVNGGLSRVPYAEPTWLAQGYHSPYFSDNHRQFQVAVRKFCEEYLYPDSRVCLLFLNPYWLRISYFQYQAREADGKRPSQSVLDAMAAQELHAMRMGPGKHLQGRTLMGGLVKPEEYDYFHELIVTQELVRTCLRGYGDGLLGGKVIGLPPVLNFGSEELKAKVVPEVLSGKKFICLAISEAYAGSDVMGLQTTAVKSEDGKEWIINGSYHLSTQ